MGTHLLTPPVPVAPPAADEPLNGVAGWAVTVMEAVGAPGAGAVVALENLFPPIPSEIILPLAGFTASQGSFTLLEAIAWTTLGSLVGALVLYWLGQAVGRDRVRAAAVRLPLVNARDIDAAERWFGRHGHKAVFFGRMLPIIRSAISVPAGVERMPLLRFVLYTTAGSLVWNAALVVAGYRLGESWTLVERYAEVLQYAVVAVAVAAVALFVASRLRRSTVAPGTRPQTSDVARRRGQADSTCASSSGVADRNGGSTGAGSAPCA